MRQDKRRAGKGVPLKPVAWYKALATRKGRDTAGAFLVEGERAVQQIRNLHSKDILEILSTDDPPFDLKGLPYRRLTESQFRFASSVRSPQGLAAVVRLPQESYASFLPESVGSRILLLEGVQDPGNVGTLIRTAAAFNFSGVLLTAECADPFSPKTVQSTAGAVLSVWIRKTPHCVELVKDLKKRGFVVFATDLQGLQNPAEIGCTKRVLLALGNEAAGISRALLDLADYRIRIPVHSEKAESLNVAVCGAICMYLCSENHTALVKDR